MDAYVWTGAAIDSSSSRDGGDGRLVLKPCSSDRSARVRVSPLDGSYSVHPSAQDLPESEASGHSNEAADEAVDITVSVQSYANQHVVVITQTQKFGNVVR
jgi:hypothetical protein